jgi:hypothetical protein
MKKRIALLSALALCSFGILKGNLQIQWINHLAGDFSFAPKQTLKGEARCYEYAGVSEIEVRRVSKDTIRCHTFANEASHSRLEFDIVGNSIVNPRIELNSIVSRDGKSKFTYSCNGGFMKIDRSMLQKNILKAEFDLTFDHPENPDEILYWKGKILSKIKK